MDQLGIEPKNSQLLYFHIVTIFLYGLLPIGNNGLYVAVISVLINVRVETKCGKKFSLDQG